MRKIIQSIVITLLIAIVSLEAKALTYKLNGTVSTQSVFTLSNQRYGIQGSFAGGQCTVKIRLRNTVLNNAILYGASSTGNDLQEQSWDYEPWFPWLAWYGNNSTTLKSTDFQTTYLHVIDFLNRNNSFVYTDNIPVEIILELTNTNLNNLDSLKLPGIGTLKPNDFLNCSNGNMIGCNSVRLWKDLSNEDNKKPLVVAHRGYHGNRATPENSLPAVINAVNEHYRYIEVDIRMTKDNIPFLFHDDLLGYTTTSTDTETPTENFLWSEISGYNYRNRYQQNSGFSLTSFAEIARYIYGKDVMVFLDIKSYPMSRNFETMAKCIKIANSYGVLHQIGFKMVRTNLSPGHVSSLNMSADSALTLMDPTSYTLLMNIGNVHVVDYDPSVNAAFIENWVSMGNVIGLELDFSKSPFYHNPSLRKDIPIYGGISPLQYFKGAQYQNKGIRIGLWSSTATDCRGRPRHDPAEWTADGPLEKGDNRARMEFISQIVPQYITHDRPDIISNYLNAIRKFNSNTFLP